MTTHKQDDHLRGIGLFNQGRFFDAHEVLEDVWRAASAEEKKTWQGLVQVAVALHHYSTGNHVGMRSVMNRAIKNLTGPPTFHGVQVARLVKSLEHWLNTFDPHHPPKHPPQIELLTTEKAQD